MALSEEASTISALLYWAADNGGLSAARILSRIPEVRPHDDWINYRLAALASPKQQTAGTWFHALDGLGRRKAGKYISLILKALQGDDPVASAVAARALARLGSREAVPEIRKKLISLEGPFGPAAVAVLVELGGAGQAHQLAREFEDWGFRASVPVLEALHRGDVEQARAAIRVVRRISERTGRLRAMRLLAELDSPALNQLPLDDVDPYWVNSLHPYLARSQYRRTRDFVLSATGDAQGPALSALLVSPRTTLDEKERAVQVLGAAWPDAVRVGGKPVVRELDRLALREPSLAVYRDTELWPSKLDSPAMLDALALLPGEQARLALEQLGTVAAIERLIRREDRLYSISALGELRRSGGRDVQEAAERALLELGAPGGLAIMQRKLAQPTDLGALAPVLAEAPLASEAFRYMAGEKGHRPDVMASLHAYHQRKPPEFLRLLSLTDPIANRRVHAAVALSGDPTRLPLLFDLAAYGHEIDARRIAFFALAEADLEEFSSRLHRTAGDPDRRIRFATALALVPSGEPWAVRLLVAEMDEERSEEVLLARRCLDWLPLPEARRLLEEMVRDGTANLFAANVLIDLPGRLDEPLRQRVWELISAQIESSSIARLVASKLDSAEAARGVCARLP